jgi:hypothetical protein
MSNKQTYWFLAKRYGWGWGMAAYLASALVSFLAYAGFLTVVLIAICWVKGEPPRWRWGGSEDA